jgi:hypothetical protein
MVQPNKQRTQTSTLEYLIVDPITNAPMKTIPLQNLPTFHGLISEDPWTHSYSNSMSYVEGMITPLNPKN